MIDTEKGLLPKLQNQQEFDEIKGMLCAVEFGTRELLGFGRTWEQCKEDVKEKGNEGRSFYRFAMPNGDFRIDE